jgi:hypothetical protein
MSKIPRRGFSIRSMRQNGGRGERGTSIFGHVDKERHRREF